MRLLLFMLGICVGIVGIGNRAEAQTILGVRFTVPGSRVLTAGS